MIMIRGMLIALLFLSTVGWWELIRRKCAVETCFIPGVAVAVQTTALFLGGLLNLLPETVALLGVAGIGGLVWAAVRDRGFSWLRYYAVPAFAFLGAVTVALGVFLYGKLFSHYDNFSHWALVLRSMLKTDRFPNFQDTVIGYRDYPLGSASWLYYICKMAGQDEWIQMLAQSYMMTVSVMPLFSCLKKNVWAGFLLILGATNYFYIFNTSLTNLLVDTLLPLVGAGATVYAFRYSRTDKPWQLLPLAFYMVQLVQIKNSGIFFAAVIGLWVLVQGRKDHRYGLRMLCVLIPIFSLLLWNRHCDYAFGAEMTSKHAMTAENYLSVFQAKTPEEIRETVSAMLRFVTSWKPLLWTAGLLAVTGIPLAVLSGKKQIAHGRVCLAMLAVLVVYLAGMLGMYLFSMEAKEATSLAGAERYARTIIVYVLDLALLPLLHGISAQEESRLRGWGLALAGTGLLLVHMQLCEGRLRHVFQYNENTEKRCWIESVREQYAIPDGGTYTILIPETDKGYAMHIGRYVFMSKEVKAFVVTGEKSLKKINGDYVLIYDRENELIQEWVQKEYPDQADELVIVRKKEGS